MTQYMVVQPYRPRRRRRRRRNRTQVIVPLKRDHAPLKPVLELTITHTAWGAQ